MTAVTTAAAASTSFPFVPSLVRSQYFSQSHPAIIITAQLQLVTPTTDRISSFLRSLKRRRAYYLGKKQTNGETEVIHAGGACRCLCSEYELEGYLPQCSV